MPVTNKHAQQEQHNNMHNNNDLKKNRLFWGSRNKDVCFTAFYNTQNIHIPGLKQHTYSDKRPYITNKLHE